MKFGSNIILNTVSQKGIYAYRNLGNVGTTALNLPEVYLTQVHPLTLGLHSWLLIFAVFLSVP